MKRKCAKDSPLRERITWERINIKEETKQKRRRNTRRRKEEKDT